MQFNVKHSVNQFGGYTIRTPPDDWIGRTLSTGTPYEFQLLRVAASISRCELVIDAGANVGNHTVYLAKSGARVVAFEPNPPILELLKQNVSENKLSDRVVIHPLGLWSSQINAEIIDGITGNSGAARVAVGQGEISCVTIDGFRLKPRLIKIDVEGAELEVLKGAMATLKAYRPSVIVETHDSLQQIASFLMQFGYLRLGGSLANSPTFLFVARRQDICRAMPHLLRYIVARQAGRMKWLLKNIAAKVGIF